jgi:hypothetical protein
LAAATTIAPTTLEFENGLLVLTPVVTLAAAEVTALGDREIRAASAAGRT